MWASEPMDPRLIDYSTLADTKRCMRRGYFKHVRGWQVEGFQIHPFFGKCMHTAMDVVWTLLAGKGVQTEETLGEVGKNAFDAFMGAWREEVPELEDERSYPKSPRRAEELIKAYIDQYGSHLGTDVELLGVEEPFITVLSEDPELYYIGRWDKVFNMGGGTWILDHKTTKTFGENFTNKFLLDAQVDGYLHGGQCHFGEDMRGVLIDGLLCQKTPVEKIVAKGESPLSRVPIEKLWTPLEQWYLETRYYVKMWRRNVDFIAGDRESKVLMACPRDTESCGDFGGCPYRTLCGSIENPENIRATPQGFEKKFWIPFDLAPILAEIDREES